MIAKVLLYKKNAPRLLCMHKDLGVTIGWFDFAHQPAVGLCGATAFASDHASRVFAYAHPYNPLRVSHLQRPNEKTEREKVIPTRRQ